MNQPVDKYDCGSVLVCMREYPLMQPVEDMWKYINHHPQIAMYFREVPSPIIPRGIGVVGEVFVNLSGMKSAVEELRKVSQQTTRLDFIVPGRITVHPAGCDPHPAGCDPIEEDCLGELGFDTDEQDYRLPLANGLYILAMRKSDGWLILLQFDGKIFPLNHIRTLENLRGLMKALGAKK